MPGHHSGNQHSLCWPEAQVNVVPKDSSIAPAFRSRSRNNRRVRVTLYDFASGPQRKFIQRVGELAQPSAYGRDKTALAQLPAFDITLRFSRTSDLLPEAEDLSARNFNHVQPPAGLAEILDLAELQRLFDYALIR